jgi:hypothetical protein
MSSEKPVIVTGYLGWGNSAHPDRRSQYELWGPGGRWSGPDRGGYAIEDTLEAEGATEGARALVVAVNRFRMTDEQWSAFCESVRQLLVPEGSDQDG